MSSSVSSKTVQCDVPHRAWPFPLHVCPGFSHAFELQHCSSEHYESVLKFSLSVLLRRFGYVKELFCFPLSQLLAWFFTALPKDLVHLVLQECRGDFRCETSMMALFAAMLAQLAKSMYDSHVNALRHCSVWVLSFKSHPAVVGSMPYVEASSCYVQSVCWIGKLFYLGLMFLQMFQFFISLYLTCCELQSDQEAN